MSKTYTIWCNADYPADAQRMLEEGLRGHRLLWPAQRASSNLVAAPPDPQLNHADIAFGQPDAKAVIDSPTLRWVQLSTAGYTRFDTPEFRSAARRKHLTLTTSSTVYAEPCAQHLASYFYAHARQLYPADAIQLSTRVWTPRMRRDCVLLGGQRVLVYGYGAIAHRLIELLAPLELDIIGVRRTPRGDELTKVVSLDEADSLLSQADYIVNILPANADSEGFFDAARIARFKPGVIFMNIGRGTTVEQSALHRALAAGEIAEAYLDVTDPEPLPPEHPLWTLPNCRITPHTAGGFAGEAKTLVHHFLSNFQRFLKDREMVDVVVH